MENLKLENHILTFQVIQTMQVKLGNAIRDNDSLAAKDALDTIITLWAGLDLNILIKELQLAESSLIKVDFINKKKVA